MTLPFPGTGATLVIEDLEVTVEEFDELTGILRQLVELQMKELDQRTRSVVEASKEGATGT